MKYRKVKNGITITVKDWDNRIILSDAKTGAVINTQIFSDHIKAITLAKML